MKKIFLLLVSLGLLNAFSANYNCTGKVTYLGVYQDGRVIVGGPGGMKEAYVCDLDNKVNGVNPDACKAMYSQLLSARSQNRTVTMVFSQSCSSIQSWKWASGFSWVIEK